MHVVHDPRADRPLRVEVTLANVNDVEIGKKTPIETGGTYVFDKGYYDFSWWRSMHEIGAFFVTRPKSNTRFTVVAERPLNETRGDGFTVIEDCEVKLASKGNLKLPMRVRRVRIERDAQKGGKPQIIEVIANDMTRSAVEIAALYKARWAIELLFRWLKQHLKIRKFMGENENAIKARGPLARLGPRAFRLASAGALGWMDAVTPRSRNNAIRHPSRSPCASSSGVLAPASARGRKSARSSIARAPPLHSRAGRGRPAIHRA